MSTTPMKADDSPIMEAISRGNREAFITLFERTSDAVRAEVAARLSDTPQAKAVFAAIYVEVWWLAGCHRGSGIDVGAWIRHIVDRRIAHADAMRRSPPPSRTADQTRDAPPSRAELELAALLGSPRNKF
jgi:DNA-directed RNA polymerase specialized sigma24 family protein